MRPYLDEGGVTLYHGNCLDVMPKIGLTMGCFLLADPPYGTGLSFDYNERFSPSTEKWWKNRDRSAGQRHAPLIGDDCKHCASGLKWRYDDEKDVCEICPDCKGSGRDPYITAAEQALESVGELRKGI